MNGATITGPTDSKPLAYGEERFTPLMRFRNWLLVRDIRRRLGGRRDLTVADLGCGYSAPMLQAMRPYLREGVGVEMRVSPELKSDPVLRFEEGPLEAVVPTFPAERFDLVLLMSVLEHLSDPLEMLRQIHRILRPGGRALVHVPTWLAKPVLEIMTFRCGVTGAESIDDHKMYYAKRDLWPLLVRAGFKPSRISMSYHKLGLCLLADVRKIGASS